MNRMAIVESVVRDGRHAARVLRKSPGFAVTAVLTLGLAIAVNTAVFSVVDSVLLKRLPYPEPDRLAMLTTVRAGGKTSPTTARHGHCSGTMHPHSCRRCIRAGRPASISSPPAGPPTSSSRSGAQ